MLPAAGDTSRAGCGCGVGMTGSAAAGCGGAGRAKNWVCWLCCNCSWDCLAGSVHVCLAMRLRRWIAKPWSAWRDKRESRLPQRISLGFSAIQREICPTHEAGNGCVRWAAQPRDGDVEPLQAAIVPCLDLRDERPGGRHRGVGPSGREHPQELLQVRGGQAGGDGRLARIRVGVLPGLLAQPGRRGWALGERRTWRPEGRRSHGARRTT